MAYLAGGKVTGGSHTWMIAAVILAFIAVALAAVDGIGVSRPNGRPLWALPLVVLLLCAAVLCVCAAILLP